MIPRGSQIQKIFTSGVVVDISIRTQGQTWHLGLGRGGEVAGLFLSNKVTPSIYRSRDYFLEYLRGCITSSPFQGIRIDGTDRIIALDFLKNGNLETIYFFYKGRELYFSHVGHNNKMEKFVFKSWAGKREILTNDLDFEIFNEIGRKSVDKIEFDQQVPSIDDLLKTFLVKVKGTSRQLKSLNRKIENIKQDLLKITMAIELEEKLKTNRCEELFEKEELSYQGFKVKFKGVQTYYQKLNLVYIKIKKMKSVIGMLEERSRSTQEEKAKLSENAEFQIKCFYPVWKKISVSHPKSETNTEFAHKIYNFETYTLAVGLSAQGNDYLRNTWSSKDDLWFHYDSKQSPHAICKVKETYLLKESDFVTIGSAIRDASKFKDTEIDLIYTAVKNLKSVKGKPGSVTFKKEKRIRIYYNEVWKNNLFDNSMLISSNGDSVKG